MIAGRIGLLALAVLATPALAAPRCAIGAYVSDRDPSGTNVRAGPSRDAAVLARLPHGQAGDPDLAPEVTIIGFRDGWAQVREAVFADYGSGRDQVLFKGSGWISGKLLSTTLNRIELRAAPAANARVVARLMGEDWGPDSALVTEIADCLGAFAKVTAKLPDGRVVQGWAEGLCSNQVTTCP